MRNLGPVEAANEIRHDVLDMPGLDPEEQHGVVFIKSVCDQLGLDHSGENMHKVAVTLHRHDIALHVGHEYPKMVVRKYDGTTHIAHDEAEEEKIVNAEPPAPVEQPRYVQEPVQDTSLDLKDKVPHTGPAQHAVDRADDALTNTAASQDAATMVGATGDNNATHDHNPPSEPEFVDGDTDGDTDEVEVEDSPAPEPTRKPVGNRSGVSKRPT